MPEDIRDKPYLTQEDVLGLNFIRSPSAFIFRRHYRAGLRSHIMEVLNPQDLKRERQGVEVGGLRSFPRARPLRMLRLFRTRFKGLRDALEEPRRIRVLETYLAPRFLARSDEFIVGYRVGDREDPLLCGLQEYVEGEILNPWRYLDGDHLLTLLDRMQANRESDSGEDPASWIRSVRGYAQDLLGRLKRMILEVNYVPDLAGEGNLILTRSGHIRLVDINNISRVSFDTAVPLDDRGYPVCDKSIEALALLEEKLLGRSPGHAPPVYRHFLDPGRMKEVKSLESEFHLAMNRETSYPVSSHPSPKP
jgi:hypothetical protein